MKFASKVRGLQLPISAIRLLIALTAVLITVFSQWAPYPDDFSQTDEWLRDKFVRAAASAEPETRIAVIDIDENSLQALGPWPWPRERIADLLEALLGPYGARGVALDLVLPEKTDGPGDARLAALAAHGPVVVAQAFDYVGRTQGLRIGHLAGSNLVTPVPGSPSATGYIANHAGLSASKNAGNIGFIPDNDGTVRRLPLVTTYDNHDYPGLSLALFNCCWPGAADFRLKQGSRRIPYVRDWDAFTVVPAADILNLTAPGESIKNRLVLIGSSSLGLTDRVATPLSPSVSGVMVHASFLSTLLDEKAGQGVRPWPGRWIAIAFSMLVAFIATYTFPRLSALINVLLLGAASLAWVMLSYWLCPHDGQLHPTGPLASMLFLLAVAVPFDWQMTQRRSRSLLGTLRQYVATAVVDELLRSDLKNPLTPRRLNVTTLIADMEGYTTYVESMSIEEAANLTRDFLACLTAPVLKKRGTIDKYTGDGLVAFWGAPLPVEDHADLALDAALEIRKAVSKFSQEREGSGMSRLRVRIGIQSGVAMAGDFGSASRSIYTAVGDSVNVAARLEQLARNQPHDIMVGRGTVEMSLRHQFKSLGEFTLRGKEKSLAVFTIDTDALPSPADSVEHLSYQAGNHKTTLS
jgi:adenylate cyclase